MQNVVLFLGLLLNGPLDGKELRQMLTVLDSCQNPHLTSTLLRKIHEQ
jgi:hypothetical protein